MKRKSLLETQEYIKNAIVYVGYTLAGLPDTPPFDHDQLLFANSFLFNLVKDYIVPTSFIEELGDMIFIGEGSDSKVYISKNDPNNVYKAKSMSHFHLSTLLCSVYAHNSLFEETYYDFLGFVFNECKIKMLLRQQFVPHDRTLTEEEIRAFLINKGFKYRHEGDDVCYTEIFTKGALYSL